MFKRLKSLFGGRKSSNPDIAPVRASGAHKGPPRVKPRPPRPDAAKTGSFSAEVSGRIEDGGPGKNILIRNRYIREDTGTHEKLKIIDDSVLDSDDEDGGDPYNTGQFDRSKSWNLRSRK